MKLRPLAALAWDATLPANKTGRHIIYSVWAAWRARSLAAR